MVAFTFVVYFIQRYMKQREQLAKAVRQQRDNLLQDVELAAEVQRMFLPLGKPAIAGLEIAGMMHPARGIGGDYYDYIPIDEHSIQLVIADVAGKGVAAALLMSATAAAVQLEVNQQRDMLQVVSRLNNSIHGVSSDGERYVTLLMAEVDAKKPETPLCELWPQSRPSLSSWHRQSHTHEFLVRAHRHDPGTTL